MLRCFLNAQNKAELENPINRNKMIQSISLLKIFFLFVLFKYQMLILFWTMSFTSNVLDALKVDLDPQDLA